MGHRFDPKHAAKLNHPDRHKMLPPDELLGMLDIQRDHTIADIGCGPGYFTIPAARLSNAPVYGVDVSSEMLRLLKEKAEDEGITNIAFVESTAEHTTLPEASVDCVICSLVLHEVDNLLQTLSEFKRILRPHGKLLLIEWEKTAMEMGPPVAHRISSQTLVETVQAVGFRAEVTHPNVSQYVILAQ